MALHSVTGATTQEIGDRAGVGLLHRALAMTQAVGDRSHRRHNGCDRSGVLAASAPTPSVRLPGTLYRPLVASLV